MIRPLSLSILLASGLLPLTALVATASRPNLLIVTVDDMSADSLGVFGCPLAETSPKIDAFARSALRFQHAHVQVGNCMPGRNIMWSGMFSQANGVEGFVQNRNARYPVLCDWAQQAGCFAEIREKYMANEDRRTNKAKKLKRVDQSRNSESIEP